jgi:hypothetical protein
MKSKQEQSCKVTVKLRKEQIREVLGPRTIVVSFSGDQKYILYLG